MSQKKRTKQKVPEKSISDKVNHYKGQTKTLRRRIDNLEKRLLELEARMNKYKKLLPEPDDAFSGYKKKEKTKKEVIEDINKKFNPSFKDSNE